jgi:hypothetical protein
MITEPVDMLDQLDQCRRRTGRLVGDNVYVSASPTAKAAFVYTPALRFEIKPHAPKIGFVPPKAFSEGAQMAVSRADPLNWSPKAREASAQRLRSSPAPGHHLKRTPAHRVAVRVLRRHAERPARPARASVCELLKPST